jgi:hypothetical protein
MAGIEEAFEKFADRLARQESKRYSRDEQGDYVEEVQDPYPIKLGPLELGANANMVTGKFSPNEYQNVSTMNRNVGLRGKYNVPDSGISLLGSIGDVRSSQNVRTDLPFNPMTGEASPYSEMRKDVYKDSPYSVGAQYNPQGTDEMYSALYNKGGGYNLGYNKGPVNVSYTSNPGLGNNVMLRGQYNFADGGVASMFRERPGYAEGGTYPSFIDGPNGIKFELVTGRFSGKPVYKAKYPEDYDFSKGAIGGSTATEFDPDQINQIAIEEQNRRENLLGKTFPEGYFDPATYEIPTVDPFSGEQVSAQDQSSFANVGGISPEDFLKENPGYVVTNLTDIAGVPRFNAYKPEVPTVDPFSGQQFSAQDQTAFTQPQAEIFPQQPSPIEQFKAERQFQSEADAAARSGIPFTKTIQNYLGNLYSGPEIANMQEQIDRKSTRLNSSH